MNAVATRIRRAVHRHNPWRSAAPGRYDVPIGELVSPLRYDVVVRAQFFEFLDAHHELVRDDPGELVRRAGESPYRTWFDRVAMARFKPRVGADPARLEAAFADRVLRAAALLDSYRTGGFDPSSPILLRVPGPRTHPAAGKPVARDLFVADGCHRLALLLYDGWPALPAELYRVDTTPLPAVPDNTARLLPMLALSTADYVRFLSLGYADRRHDDLAALFADVAASRPERIVELRAVVAADAARGHGSPGDVGGRQATPDAP